METGTFPKQKKGVINRKHGTSKFKEDGFNTNKRCLKGSTTHLLLWPTAQHSEILERGKNIERVEIGELITTHKKGYLQICQKYFLIPTAYKIPSAIIQMRLVKITKR